MPRSASTPRVSVTMAGLPQIMTWAVSVASVRPVRDSSAPLRIASSAASGNRVSVPEPVHAVALDVNGFFDHMAGPSGLRRDDVDALAPRVTAALKSLGKRRADASTRISGDAPRRLDPAVVEEVGGAEVGRLGSDQGVGRGKIPDRGSHRRQKSPAHRLAADSGATLSVRGQSHGVQTHRSSEHSFAHVAVQ